MKLKKGDVVRYAPQQELSSHFFEQWGRGPFIVRDPSFAGKDTHWTFTTLDGIPLTNPRFNNGANWYCSTDGLILDVFLTAARKAVNGHQKKCPLQRKCKAS